jgi:hypothetical protein
MMGSQDHGAGLRPRPPTPDESQEVRPDVAKLILTNVLTKLQGKKTYIAAVGLLGLGVFQLTQGDVTGVQTLLQAAVAAGLRDAVNKL